MITLYQGPIVWGIPNMSPFCIKVETYLRMAGLEYQTKAANFRKAPKGKIPYIKDQGICLGDSSFIIEYLKQTYGDPLDADLSSRDRALSRVVTRTIEEGLYFVGVYLRWIEDHNWPYIKEALAQALPPVIGPVILSKIRKNVGKTLHRQGLGRHTRDEIYKIGCDDLTALSELLGDKPFFLGDKPRSLDATVYSFLISLIEVPMESPLKEHGKKLNNFSSYCKRMRERYFRDWAHS